MILKLLVSQLETGTDITAIYFHSWRCSSQSYSVCYLPPDTDERAPTWHI